MLLQGQEFAQGGSFNDWQQLDWQNLQKLPGIIEAYKHLIDLRKNIHGVSAGLMGQSTNITHVDEDNKVISYHRWDKGGPKDDVVVIANFANRTHKEYVLGLPRNGTWRVRFNSSWKGYHPQFKGVEVPEVQVESGTGSIVLPPSSVLILSQDG
jgi:1,4-alpha-glucan branching enzyme